jgi:hypothetical protein
MMFADALISNRIFTCVAFVMVLISPDSFSDGPLRVQMLGMVLGDYAARSSRRDALLRQALISMRR